MKSVEPDREYPYPKLVEPDRNEGAPRVETTTLKLVEPGREERATRVETPGTRKTNPTPSPRTKSPWFRHDRLATARRSAQPTSPLPSQSSRTATKEHPESKPPPLKLVEPGREERATRVETKPYLWRFSSRTLKPGGSPRVVSASPHPGGNDAPPNHDDGHRLGPVRLSVPDRLLSPRQTTRPHTQRPHVLSDLGRHRILGHRGFKR